jgi:hypothetical protein
VIRESDSGNLILMQNQESLANGFSTAAIKEQELDFLSILPADFS